MVKGESYIGCTSTLFALAKQAYGRTRAASSDHELGQSDALVAVLFSAATLESYIADVALYCKIFGRSYRVSAIEAIGNTLDEMEAARGTVRGKYTLAMLLFSQQPFDKSKQPYQDFSLLFTLRDSIVHLKPVKVPQDTDKMMARLTGKGLCQPLEANVLAAWVDCVTTRAVARWACNVVATMEDSIRDAMAKFPVHELEGAQSALDLLAPRKMFEPVE